MTWRYAGTARESLRDGDAVAIEPKPGLDRLGRESGEHVRQTLPQLLPLVVNRERGVYRAPSRFHPVAGHREQLAFERRAGRDGSGG